MSQTPNLTLPYIMAAQAQKHVTHNEALRALDAVVQLAVAERGLATPPASPPSGVRYIVPGGATDAWSGHGDAVAAYQDGAWIFYPPQVGWLAWVADEGLVVAWNGTAWVAAGNVPPNPTPLVGVNTTADATNRLAVKSDAVLLSHDDVTPGNGDMRINFNKQAAGRTAALLFQTGYSGRAEIGTTGDDKLHVKVSANGSTWAEAMVVDSTGRVGLGTATPQDRLHIVGDTPSFTVHNTNLAQFTGSAFSLRGPDSLAGHAQTRLVHGNNNVGATQAYFAISSYNQLGTFTSNLAIYRFVNPDWVFLTNGVSRLEIGNADTRPGADNAYSLGTASRRWSQVFAANGTIQTSDARDKADVETFDESAAGGLVDAVAPVTFRWTCGRIEVRAQDQETGALDSVAHAGRRRHAGFIAQDVKAAMTAGGMDFAAWGLDDHQDADSRQWLRPDELIPVLWAAVRGLRRQVADLQARVKVAQTASG